MQAQAVIHLDLTRGETDHLRWFLRSHMMDSVHSVEAFRQKLPDSAWSTIWAKLMDEERRVRGPRSFRDYKGTAPPA